MPVAYLRTGMNKARVVGVDRKNNVLRGYVVVQKGPIKDGRGEFDDEGLSLTADLINEAAKGVKARFTHPGLSNDGLGKFLGRAMNATIEGDMVRADLHFAESAFKTPNGDLAGYVMDLAEEDSDALSSSMVVRPRELFRMDKDGKPLVDEDGKRLPPLWYPEKIMASDIVDEGAAVDGLLSAGIDVEGLPDEAVWFASELLNKQFPGLSREELMPKIQAFVTRYLDLRYGTEKPVSVEPTRDSWRDRLRIHNFAIDGGRLPF